MHVIYSSFEMWHMKRGWLSDCCGGRGPLDAGKKRSRNDLTRSIVSSQGSSKLAFSLFLFFMALSLSLSSTSIAICLFSSPSPSLPPCLPPSCQGVYMCPADGTVPNKVERIRGEKTVLLPAMFSLFSSFSLSRSLALTVDIFQLMYSWPLLLGWRINKTFIYIVNDAALLEMELLSILV